VRSAPPFASLRRERIEPRGLRENPLARSHEGMATAAVAGVTGASENGAGARCRRMATIRRLDRNTGPSFGSSERW